MLRTYGTLTNFKSNYYQYLVPKGTIKPTSNPL